MCGGSQRKEVLILPGRASRLRVKLIFKLSQHIGRGLLRTNGGCGLGGVFWAEEITCVMA